MHELNYMYLAESLEYFEAVIMHVKKFHPTVKYQAIWCTRKTKIKQSGVLELN